MQLRTGKVVYNGLPLINEKGLTVRMSKFADCFSDFQLSTQVFQKQHQQQNQERIGMTLRSRVIILPEKGNSTYKEVEIDKLKSDFKIVMFDIIGRRIKLVEKLSGSKTYDDYLNKMRLVYEIYYSLNYHSDTIFSYMHHVKEKSASTKDLIIRFLERIQVMYDEIPSLPQTTEFMKMFDRLYYEWDETLRIYEPLYV